MKSIKALVIFMGLLIVAGLGLLVYGMANQVSTMTQSGGFDAASVALPAGCELAEARIDEGRLVLRVAGPLSQPDCQQVILLDPDSGVELGRIHITPKP